MRQRMKSRNGQSGAVAIVVALSLAVLLGFVGLATDLGRLYVNKTELQSAADACALAAANELVCDTSVAGTCPTSYLQNAENAGIFAASKNLKDFQGSKVNIAASDVKFSTVLGPNSGYQVRNAANPNSKYAMCTARSNGIVPWFMGILGAGASDVSATAVATLAAGQSFCNAAPFGICSAGAAPNFGLSIGQWITSNFTSTGSGAGQKDDLTSGTFRWVDFTPAAGGNCEIRDQLIGNGTACGIKVGDNVQQPGGQWGAKSAWNTRFGIYPKGGGGGGNPAGCSPANYDKTTAPPDRTGYAYPEDKPPGSIVFGVSAYANYRAKQGVNAPFDEGPYDISKATGGDGKVLTGNDIVLDSVDLAKWGSERRLVAVPIIDCLAGTTVPIRGMACVLMLNPMANGNGKIFVEYRGLASKAGSPCRSAGVPGGSGGSGPQIPTLVQ